MDNMSKAIILALKEFEHECGKLEDGDEFVTCFNDGVLIISFIDEELGVKFILGEPYKIDFDLNMLENEEEK